MNPQFDDFLCEAQCEEMYDEQTQQELHEWHTWVEQTPNEQEPNQDQR